MTWITWIYVITIAIALFAGIMFSIRLFLAKKNQAEIKPDGKKKTENASDKDKPADKKDGEDKKDKPKPLTAQQIMSLCFIIQGVIFIFAIFAWFTFMPAEVKKESTATVRFLMLSIWIVIGTLLTLAWPRAGVGVSGCILLVWLFSILAANAAYQPGASSNGTTTATATVIKPEMILTAKVIAGKPTMIHVPMSKKFQACTSPEGTEVTARCSDGTIFTIRDQNKRDWAGNNVSFGRWTLNTNSKEEVILTIYLWSKW